MDLESRLMEFKFILMSRGNGILQRVMLSYTQFFFSHRLTMLRIDLDLLAL